MRWGLPCFILVASTGLVGCGHYQYSKAVRPDKRIAAIVSLSPSTTEIIMSSNSSMLLKGRTAYDNYPLSVKSVPVVASLKPDYEAIKAVSPNLIVLDSLLYNGADMEKIKALGIETFAIDANNIADFEKEIYAMGDLIGNQTNTSDYVDRIEIARNSAISSKPTTPIKVAVIMPEHGGTPMISGTKSFLGNVITEEGGTVVGPAIDRFVPLQPEMLTTDNPDLIIMPTSKATAIADLASIMADPHLKATKAVQTKHIVAFDQDVLLRRGIRVDKLIDDIHKSFSFGAKS